MIPFARLDGIFGHRLEGVRRPFVDDVGADAVVLDPQIPAAEIVLIVHAGDDGAAGDVLRELDPGAVGKALVLLEVADVGQFHGRAGSHLNAFAAMCPPSQATPEATGIARGLPSTVRLSVVPCPSLSGA